MEKFFRDIPLFVEVAKQKSFTGAARVLSTPTPTISRRIAAMEEALGMPLFHRGPRKTELTDNGRRLYERCRDIVTQADEALDELFRDMKEPAGKVRFSIAPDVYANYLSGVVSGFAARWPSIHLHAHFSERWVDLHVEPFDLDIRVGPLPDSDLIVRRLHTVQPRLYASPMLMERYRIPTKPGDLSKIPCISIANHGDYWELSKGKKKEKVPVFSVHTVNSISLSLELALAGIGVAWLVPIVAAKHEESGDLLPLLPDWHIPGGVLNAVMADRHVPQRVRLFLDYLVEHFSGASSDGSGGNAPDAP